MNELLKAKDQYRSLSCLYVHGLTLNLVCLTNLCYCFPGGLQVQDDKKKHFLPRYSVPDLKKEARTWRTEVEVSNK